MDPFPRLVRSLLEADVRFVLIGLRGANLYARTGHEIFSTQDHELFLPPEAEALFLATHAEALEQLLERDEH